jgi:hypothetical protein
MVILSKYSGIDKMRERASGARTFWIFAGTF